MEYLRKRLGREASGRPVPSSTGTTIPLEHSQATRYQEQEPDPEVLEEDYDVIQDTVPIRFLENRIRTLSRTSVPLNLSRLKQHKENMIRFYAERDWDKLTAEQLNASRTVQQLKGHLQTLDELRQQVRGSEMVSFDNFTRGVRGDILTAVQDYQVLTATLQSERDLAEGGGVAGEEEGEGEGREDQRLLLAQKEAVHYQSLEELQSDLVELNDLVKHLNTVAHEHSERVARLNTTTESAAASVKGGVTDLRASDRLKAYVLPVGGAIAGGLLGGVVAGPVGAFAGLKIGALTAATAGTAGILGGAFIGYRVRKATNNQNTADNTGEGSDQPQLKKEE